MLVKGRMLTPAGLVEGSIRVEGEKISKLSGLAEEDEEVYDFTGKGLVILPGLIDMHVHLRDWQLSYKEDFYTGTCAAAAGGFVAVCDMPNTRPKVDSVERLREREALASEKAVVDYGLYVGVGKMEKVEELAVGLKLFMQHDYYSEKRGEALAALRYARERMVTVVHAENPSLYSDTPLGMMGTPEAEEVAVREICRQGGRLHITHLSSAAGLASLKGATCDTCPHYLLLGGEKLDARGKVHPSIKQKKDSEALLKALLEGRIHAVTSDHAPHQPWEKEGPAAPGGFPGLETTLPLLLTLVNRGILTLGKLVEVCSTNPAKLLGLRNFGSLEAGNYASLTVVDLEAEGEIRAENFKSKSKFSPFEGWKVKGMPVATFVRGTPVMMAGEILVKPGCGKNLKKC